MLTSAMTPTLMVVAVSPTSLPGAVPAGEADGEVAADDAGAADDDVAAADDEVAGAGAEVVLLEERHPAASRTAAATAAVSAAIRALLGVLRPVPPRPGSTLLGLTLALHDFIACEPSARRCPRVHRQVKLVPGGQ